MVRSRWWGPGLAVLAWTGLAWGQGWYPQGVVEVREAGKPPLKCRVLRCWREKDGTPACQVQALATGEVLTILDQPSAPGAPSATPGTSRPPRIFHGALAGTPEPPRLSPVPQPSAPVGKSAAPRVAPVVAISAPPQPPPAAQA